MKRLSDQFLIGAATAAHQVEGNNRKSDFWTMEHLPGTTYKEPSLDACDHYNQYRTDIKLLADFGYNSYRFSIEWARIEPKEGQFDEKEIQHYRDVLECCLENGITPIVTLHHFSSPEWLIEEGGWESEKTIDYFVRYAQVITDKLGDLIPYICTINEANMGVQISRIMKKFMAQIKEELQVETKNADIQVGLNLPEKSKVSEYDQALEKAFGIPSKEIHTFLAPRTKEGDLIIIRCHQKARDAIKQIRPEIMVGASFSLYDYQVLPGGEKYIEELWDEDLFHYMPYLEGDDFIGIQNYTRKVFGPEGQIEPASKAKMTEMGNEYYPRSLAGVLRFVAKHWDKPMLVTENGISTSNDEERVEFIKEALEGVHECLEEGLDIKGYMHWSLMDNFEWQKGYDQKFGLIAVDRATQKRYPKESFKVLGEIKRKEFLN